MKIFQEKIAMPVRSETWKSNCLITNQASNRWSNLSWSSVFESAMSIRSICVDWPAKNVKRRFNVRYLTGLLLFGNPTMRRCHRCRQFSSSKKAKRQVAVALRSIIITLKKPKKKVHKFEKGRSVDAQGNENTYRISNSNGPKAMQENPIQPYRLTRC